MTWFLLGYLAALLYVSANRHKFARLASLRLAWIFFACIPLSHFFFALLRAGNFGDTRDMALVEIWNDGVVWLLLGISILYLAGSVAPPAIEPADRASVPPPPPPPPLS